VGIRIQIQSMNVLYGLPRDVQAMILKLKFDYDYYRVLTQLIGNCERIREHFDELVDDDGTYILSDCRQYDCRYRRKKKGSWKIG
jgi:hypothetical protein